MAEQVSIFDELSRQDTEAATAAAEAEGPLAAYRHRYRYGRLIPGESCPACGHIFPGRYDATNDHHLVTDTVCTGMDLTRSHLTNALRTGSGVDMCRSHAIRAGWPVEQVDAWISAGEVAG